MGFLATLYMVVMATGHTMDFMDTIRMVNIGDTADMADMADMADTEGMADTVDMVGNRVDTLMHKRARVQSWSR